MVFKGETMNQLEKNRQLIDEIDTEIAELYERRMNAVKEILAYKKEHRLPILDVNREKDVIAKNVQRIKNAEYAKPYEDFLQKMMKNSRDYQQSLLSQDIVAYAGIKGSFAQLASQRLFPGSPVKQYERFDDVFQAVINRQAQYGVLPLENTNSGIVGAVLDGLFTYPVYVSVMADQKIDQCLLGVPGATLKDIEQVYSKDEALSQSRQFLRQLNAETIAYPNTAVAAQYVANENDIHKAAIGARENAQLYNLEVLANNVTDTNTNTTRFIVISRQPQTEGDRFSILFTTSHTSGALAKIIEIIAKYGLNMDNIQSRPRHDKPFEYYFFIEMEGDSQSENTRQCLDEIKENCEAYKFLGVYPVLTQKEEDQ